MYDLINVFSVASIVLLNEFNSKYILHFITGYTIIDAIYILKNKLNRRGVQLVTHHLATICVTSLTCCQEIKPFLQFVPRIVRIDISTLLIMISKMTKIRVLHPISMIVWFYSRVIYFPLLVMEMIKTAYDITTVSHNIMVISLITITYLGFVWTLESLRVISLKLL